MIYKNERWIIKKEDLSNNSILSKDIILKEEKNSVIKGKVVDFNDNPISGCVVIAIEVDEINGFKNCISIAYTDEKGTYCISIMPQKNKLYSIEVYTNIDIVKSIRGGMANGNI